MKENIYEDPPHAYNNPTYLSVEDDELMRGIYDIPMARISGGTYSEINNEEISHQEHEEIYGDCL